MLDTSDRQARAAPREIESELWVLGAVMIDPWRLDDLTTEIRPSDFFVEAHGMIFQAMLDLKAAEVPIDQVGMARAMKANHRLMAETDGNPMAVLLGAIAECVLTAHVPHHAARVQAASTRRGIIAACEAAVVEAFSHDGPPEELLAKVESRLIAVQDERCRDKLSQASEAANEALEELGRRMAGERDPAGVPTGFADLDRFLTTLRPGELTILAARPGMGKTAMAANVAAYAAMDHKTPTLFVSLEMSKLELADRVLSSRTDVRLSDMREGKITPEERRKIVQAAAELGHSRFWIDDSPSRSVLEISATARRLKRRNDLGLLIVDYLQLIEPEDRKAPREQQVAVMSRRLKRLARELSIPVLCLAQLNRMNESQSDKRPKLSHLRESGAIEQDADVVLFLFREEYYLSPKEVQDRGCAGTAEAIIAKQRNGKTGTAKLCWLENFTKFVNAARPWQAGKEFEPDEWSPRD